MPRTMRSHLKKNTLSEPHTPSKLMVITVLMVAGKQKKEDVSPDSLGDSS